MLDHAHRVGMDFRVGQDQAITLALISITGNGCANLLACLCDQEVMKTTMRLLSILDS